MSEDDSLGQCSCESVLLPPKASAEGGLYLNVNWLLWSVYGGLLWSVLMVTMKRVKWVTMERL